MQYLNTKAIMRTMRVARWPRFRFAMHAANFTVVSDLQLWQFLDGDKRTNFTICEERAWHASSVPSQSVVCNYLELWVCMFGYARGAIRWNKCAAPDRYDYVAVFSLYFMACRICFALFCVWLPCAQLRVLFLNSLSNR